MTEAQEKMLNEVHAAIVGNEKMGHEGVIVRLRKLEDYKKKDEKFKNRLAGGVAVGSFAGAGLWQWIKNVLF